MLIMEHLCIVYAIEHCVMALSLKPKLLKFKNLWSSIQKQLPFGTKCFLVPFLDNLVLVLALRSLEISVALFFGFHFPNYLL